MWQEQDIFKILRTSQFSQLFLDWRAVTATDFWIKSHTKDLTAYTDTIPRTDGQVEKKGTNIINFLI